MKQMDRRKFLQQSTQLAIGAGIGSAFTGCSDLLSEEEALAFETAVSEDNLFFKISLAEWSLHKTIWAGEMEHLDFAKVARNEFGIEAIEYVNQFFIDKAEDTAYLNQMNQRANDNGVEQLIIMVDMEGSLATLKEENRKQAIENHLKWINAAKYLGCHSIRVSTYGKGDRTDVLNAAVDSLGQLATYAAKEDLNIVVENHGGYSSDASWLAEVMRQVNLPNCGTLPDFGNFRMSLFPPKTYDRLKGMRELMPFAKGVSAKCYDFDRNGNHKAYDLKPILAIIKQSAYTGHIGIEYEGYKLGEYAGIKATKKLLVEEGRAI